MLKNKILSILLASLMIISMPMCVGASTFTDVSEKTHSWAIEAIETMADKGFIKGYSDGTFKPDNTVSKLEALSLTARILGVQNEENETVLKTAIETYSEIVDEYKLNFGSNEVCYLLFKNIISVDELDEYIDASNVSKGMKRYEMAVLLTKALDAEDEVSKNLITTLEYSDVDEIPAYAKKYVEYVTGAELMSGVGDNMFSPNTDVTRAQSAILMNKLLNMTNYSYYSGVVADMDSTSKTIKIKTDDGELKYTVNSNIVLRFEGTQITANDVASGYDAVVTLKDDTLYAIDFITPLVDKEINGVVSSVSTGATPSISIYVIDDNDVIITSDVKESYPLGAHVVITYNDSASTLQTVKAGNFVNIVVKKGEVATVRAYDKTKTISGVVNSVEITPVCKLNITDDNDDTHSYLVGNDVEVSRNGSKVTAADVLSGDLVTVTTTYNRITKIVASGKKTSDKGIIEEVIISANPRITIKTADGNKTYSITTNCTIDLPGVNLPTFYDLRVGTAVELSIEGATVVKLSANVSEGVTQITGIVTSVNTSYAVIQVNYIDAITGISVTEPVFVKSKATIIDTVSGKTIKLNSVKNGAKITAFGVRNNGVFESTTVNVTNN